MNRDNIKLCSRVTLLLSLLVFLHNSESSGCALGSGIDSGQYPGYCSNTNHFRVTVLPVDMYA